MQADNCNRPETSLSGMKNYKLIFFVKALFCFHKLSSINTSLTLLIQHRSFRTCLRMEGGGGQGGKNAPIPMICHIYPTMMKLGTLILYVKKIRKIYKYKSRDTALKFC